MAEQKQQPKPQQEQKKKAPQPDKDNYLIFYHEKEVEVHIDYGGKILRLTGKIMTKARYDIILDFVDEKGKKQRLIINKAYLVAVRPLE